MATAQSEIRDMGRVLCAHQWRDLHEWVGAIRALAELSDAEIVEIERRAARAAGERGAVAGTVGRQHAARG